MNKQNQIYIGIAGLLFLLIALFTPVGALFLTLIGIITFFIWKNQNKS